MKIVFLCSGISKRMFPITDDKFLLKFMGKTLLEHQIETAKKLGFTEFAIVANPQNINRIKEITASRPYIEVDIALQKEPLGIANALETARPLSDGEIIVASPDDTYECAINAMAKDERRIKVIGDNDDRFWKAIKYPWHILDMVRHLLDECQGHISPSARISDKAIIDLKNRVVISDNVKVYENAVIRGPVYIGPNSTIGNNSLVRDYSHIGANCEVGYSTEVKNSYIGDGCKFHWSYIGDSIIGEGCNFAAGTVVANWRFDEKTIRVKIEGELVDTGLVKFGSIIGNNCKTGVNASIMPGKKVGPNSIVGTNVCLTEDLEPDTMIQAGPVYKKLFDNKKKGPKCVE